MVDQNCRHVTQKSHSREHVLRWSSADFCHPNPFSLPSHIRQVPFFIPASDVSYMEPEPLTFQQILQANPDGHAWKASALYASWTPNFCPEEIITSQPLTWTVRWSVLGTWESFPMLGVLTVFPSPRVRGLESATEAVIDKLPQDTELETSA